MINKLTTLFFRTLYRLKPPPMVSYWKKSDTCAVKKLEMPDGSYALEMDGEKEIYPGFPRAHVLTGSFARLKKGLKHHFLNTAFAALEKMAEDSRIDMLPKERMVPAVRHIWETFEKLEECEVVPDMKARIALIKVVMCQVLSEDDSYRFRAQMFLELINQKKIRLSKADLYYARGKYWRADRYKKIFGKVVDAYDY